MIMAQYQKLTIEFAAIHITFAAILFLIFAGAATALYLIWFP